jgi:valyl-tRNA synthetase
MPFVTEEIWQHLPHDGEALIIAPWPEPDPLDEEAEAEMEPFLEMVRRIRNIRAEYEVDPSRPIAAIIEAGDRRGVVASLAPILSRLARIDEAKLDIEKKLAAKPPGSASAVVPGIGEIFLPLAGLVDIERERERIAAELEKTRLEIARVERLLSNQGFVSKAPAEVVNRERDKLEEHGQRYTKLEERLKSLQSLSS